ncbi:hypothetical protein FQN50_002097 [Emmonsiellopsis sp. PD_5]|nr:hypothetical protein FQN50_002097 [Emmonsiellopsis sp. PD_5]
MAFEPRYKIFRKSVNNQSQSIFQPEAPNTQEYTYVASSLSIAVSLLDSAAAKHAMVRVIRQIDPRLPLNQRLFQGRPDGDIRTQVDQFVAILQGRTPMIVLDPGLHRAVSAYHPRIEWSGNFVPEQHAVFVNLKLVDDMVNASNSLSAFRRFQFQFANMFFHEIGAHVLVTFLYHGRPTTPPTAIAPGWIDQTQLSHIPGTVGESGRLLEFFAFGGTLEFYNTPEISTPWIVRNGRAQKVTAATIDTAVRQRGKLPSRGIISKGFTDNSEVFTLPYPTTGGSTEVTSLVRVNGGQHLSQPAEANVRGLIARAMQMPFRFRISAANLRQVPNNPSILAQAA